MKKSKFSEHEIITLILKEYDSGKSIKDICREHEISAPTFYQWKQKSGGMDAQLKHIRVARLSFPTRGFNTHYA